MRAKLFGLMTGVALLSSIGVASAGNPIALTDAQLDKVTAGVATALVEAAVQGGTTSNGTFLLAASNTSATVGSALAVISTNFTPTGIAPHTLALAAAASAP
jgi:hypothetical protein